MNERQPHSDVGILLANIGSPTAPTPAAVRTYLREFLSDRRVVDAPRVLWWLVLNLIILPRRSPRSAALYARVWTDEGSPLVAITRRQAEALQRTLEQEMPRPPKVDWGMRYGQPDLAAALARLREAGCRRILLLPLYPQHSGTTTGTCMDAVTAILRRSESPPELHHVNDYHSHPGYISALAASVREHRARDVRPGHLLISFHGLPQRYVDAGDPYPGQCTETARLLAAELALAPDAWSLAYQSRFGRGAWLEPATDHTLVELGRQGRDVDVICPGFAADCLETLEEISISGRELFERAGGGRFRYIPALNDRADHVATLAAIVRHQLAGWIEPAPTEA
jgi:ferrochelatase